MECVYVTYKSIKGFPNYRVGDDGSVWSRKSGNWRKLRIKPNSPYPKVWLRNCSRVKFSVHRLVLECFLGGAPAGMEACHNNGIPSDNRLENLRWDTKKGNNADKKKHGTYVVGEMTNNSVLTELQVREIRHKYRLGISQRSLAKSFGVTQAAISNIITKRCWKHLA